MKPVAPAKPGPPNAPNAFWAPCARNTAPSANRGTSNPTSAFDAVERHSRASIARFGLGTTEFGVLEVLYHKGESPVCDVQRRILVESSSTTYVVDKLCARGLVRRRPSATDRCVTLLALTAAGRRLMRHIFPPHAQAMRSAVAALPARDQTRAAHLLRALGLGAAKRLKDKETKE